MSTADQLAAYVCSHGRSGLERKTVDYARLLLLDFLAVGLFGANQPGARRLHSALQTVSGPRGAATFTGGPLSVAHAAFFNALCAHSTDWDDSHLSAITHPGAPIWAAVLALAEQQGSQAEDVLTAAVVGYETTIRLGRAIQPHHMFQGFHGTATCGAFGAAAACARLLGLDREQTRNALGLAASSASGLTQCIVSGSQAKSFQAAKAANDGVMAALLADAGLDAPAESIDGPRGFLRAYAADAQCSVSTEDLGDRDSILTVMIKRYPIAAHLHGAVDAAIALSRRVIIDPADVVAIEVVVDPAIARNNSNREPQNHQAACMSLPFCIGASLWLNYGSPEQRLLEPDSLTECLEQEGVRALARKVECLPWPAELPYGTGTSMWSRVTVRTRGGEQTEEAAPEWGSTAPNARNVIIEKARNATSEILDPRRQALWIEQIMTGDRLGIPSSTQPATACV